MCKFLLGEYETDNHKDKNINIQYHHYERGKVLPVLRIFCSLCHCYDHFSTIFKT